MQRADVAAEATEVAAKFDAVYDQAAKCICGEPARYIEKHVRQSITKVFNSPCATAHEAVLHLFGSCCATLVDDWRRSRYLMWQHALWGMLARYVDEAKRLRPLLLAEWEAADLASRAKRFWPMNGGVLEDDVTGLDSHPFEDTRPANDQRGAWLYQLWVHRGMTESQLYSALAEHPNVKDGSWYLPSPKKCVSAAKKYATKHGLEIPRRRKGRRRTAK